MFKYYHRLNYFFVSYHHTNYLNTVLGFNYRSIVQEEVYDITLAPEYAKSKNLLAALHIVVIKQKLIGLNSTIVDTLNLEI